uniref:Geminin n=1 Tax=Ciona savignyi TaxID=51511 RepID=H2ZLS7_CIOSA
MTTKSILESINAQWKENDCRSPSRKRRLDDQNEQSPNTTKRRHLHANKKGLHTGVLKPGQENLKRAVKTSKSESIKTFFSGVPRVSCSKTDKVQIFNEAKKPKAKTTSTQTRNEVEELVCSGEPTEKYWELLAEERRKGLQEALVENKQLADEIEKKDEIIEGMKTEIERLEETASHAQYLASVIEQLGQDCLDEENEDPSKTDSDSSSGTVAVADNATDNDNPPTVEVVDTPTVLSGQEETNESATNDEQSINPDSDKENKLPLSLNVL